MSSIFDFLRFYPFLDHFRVKSGHFGGTPKMANFDRKMAIFSSILVEITSNRVQNDRKPISDNRILKFYKKIDFWAKISPFYCFFGVPTKKASLG